MAMKDALSLPNPGWDFPFQRPLLPRPERWLPYLAPAYAHHWFSNFGPIAQSLEERLAARAQRPVQVVANGTIAIAAALLTLNRKGPVILPSFTFPATLMAVLEAGCTPVLADVDPVSWEMGPDQVARVLSGMRETPVAILGVRPFGLCRDQSPLEEWCRDRGLPFILDAAAALGGTLPDGRPVGSQGFMETFSLHATKVFAVGEGGAIACDPQWQARLRQVINFGMEKGHPSGAGVNGKLSEFVAAIGLAQDDVFDEHLRIRRAAAERYRIFFAAHWPDWTPPWDSGNPPWQAYPLLAPSHEALADVLHAATAQGVQLRRYYHPTLHQSTFGTDYAHMPLPVSEALASRMLCFPIYSDMDTEEQGRLLDRLSQIRASSNAG
jgi:dTDP-4-amino-4,6-dideoxygalactose transaminase